MSETSESSEMKRRISELEQKVDHTLHVERIGASPFNGVLKRVEHFKKTVVAVFLVGEEYPESKKGGLFRLDIEEMGSYVDHGLAVSAHSM
jgi:hypothetical protein